jgi:hypothetical protein
MPFKYSSVKKAEQKLMVVEENNDPLLPVADDGRFTPGTGNNVMSARHTVPKAIQPQGTAWFNTVWLKKGRSVSSFIDGHVDATPPSASEERDKYDPTY